MTQAAKTSLKKSNIPWIWEIPEDWEVRRLKYLTPDNRYYPIWDWDHWAIKPDMYKDNGIPYFRVQNLTWSWEISYDWMVYISKETHKNNPKSILYPNDILIAKTGATIWKLCLIPNSIPESNTTSSVWKISVNHQKYNVRFILYSMMSPYFRNQYELDAYEKSAQPWFNIEDLINYVLVIPPLSTQAAIANFLEQKTTEIKKFIENKKKLIELLKEQKQSIIHRAVTKGIDPNARMKDSGIPWIGEIPEDWEVRRLKYLIWLKSGYAFKSSDYIQESKVLNIRMSNIKPEYWFDLHYSPTYLPESYYDDFSEFRIYDGDLIIAMTDMAWDPKILWKPATVKTEWFKLLMNQRVCKIDIFSSEINQEFLSYFLSDDLILQQLKIKWEWSVQLNISNDDILNLTTPLPSKITQGEIVQYINWEISRINLVIEKIEKEITLIEEYQISLIYQAVTGKISIS